MINMENFRLSVIIPLHNEEDIVEKNTKKLIDFFNRKRGVYEIILGDNGSTDSTPEKCHVLAKRFKQVKFIRLEEKGIGLALKEMIRRARFGNIVFLPIDFSVDMKFVDEALKLLDKYDIVIGSKRTEGAIDDRPLDRRISTFVFNFLVNLFFDLGINDTQCVKAFRKSKIKKINERIKSKDMFFDVELLLKAKKSGLKMIEIPVSCKDHRKSNFIIPLEFFRTILRIINLYR